MSHPDFPEERQKLEGILAYLRDYQKVIAGQKSVIDKSVSYSLAHYNDDNAEQFNELVININRQDFLTQKTADVARALQKPYFARVDFAEDGDGGNGGGGAGGAGGEDADARLAAQRHYIGKMTLLAQNSKDILIVDWRAPLSTLYYEGRIGQASYDCPDGLVTGEISLKRQYEIEAAELRQVTDIDITTNDTFLQAALGSSKDNRLHDIVTTIQAEQNRIIRADMFRPLIVQGAAGSGKTTIALHRIAYLLYTYEEKLRPKNVMIIAPSKFFLSYISGVLPELGVENVKQTTFEDFALELIGRRLRVRPPVELLAYWIERGAWEDDAGADADGGRAEWLSVSGIKSSLRFARLMERYYKWIEKTSLPKTAFTVEGYELVSHEVLARYFYTDYSYLPLALRLREIKKSLSNILKREKKRVAEEIHAEYAQIHKDITRAMPDSAERRRRIIELLAERDTLLERFQSACKTAVAGYLKLFQFKDAVTYYAALAGSDVMMAHLAQGRFTADELAAFARRTTENFRKGFVDSEDLAPLMFLQYRVHGFEDAVDIKHIVIDEAQDFGPYQFYVLRMILGTGSFSILGDLHQGIYAYKGVRRWDELLAEGYGAAADGGAVGDGGDNGVFHMAQMRTLEQSYRTTVEIMDAANVVIGKLGLPGVPLAKPVIRHGSPVGIHRADSLLEVAAAIREKLSEFAERGYKSVAIICKTASEAAELKELLPPGIELLTGGEDDFTRGIKLIPSYHVKGLEFDAVCIANASAKMYRDGLDIKLLYVAMTRALHALEIYSVGEPTALLD